MAILCLSAGTAAFQGPDLAVEAALRYQEARDFQGYVSVLDPDVIQDFHQFILYILDLLPADEVDSFVAFFAPGYTAESFRTEDPARILEAFLRTYFDVLSLHVSGTIVGTVYESEDIAHVVIRGRAILAGTDLPAFTTLEVLTTRRTPDGWRVRFNGDRSLSELLNRSIVLAEGGR